MKIRSLRMRWILALVAVCVLEAVLVAVAVRVMTARAFERFVIEEAFEVFVARVENEARTQGTLTAEPPRHPPRRPPNRTGRSPSVASLGRGIAFGLADAQGRVIRSFEGHLEGERLPPDKLAAGRPIVVEGRRVGTAFVPRDAAKRSTPFDANTPEARFIASSTAALTIALAVALSIALGVGVWLAGRTVRPLRTLTDAARAIASGQLRQSVDVTQADEIGALAEAFNTMSTRLAEANALRQQMTADVSHDLRTPVTAVLGTLELIETGVLAPTPERLRAARVEAERLARLVESFHMLALADASELPIHLTRLDVVDALSHAATLFEAQAHAGKVELAVEANEVSDVCADADRLAQVLANLISNALRHTPPGGRVVLSAQPVPGGITISVTDTGSGIPPSVLPHVFERSVRADAARSGRGAGLGLSIVRSLVEAMGGTVGIESTPGAGTTITFMLLSWSTGYGDELRADLS